jgi:hypothetical protein
MSSIPLSTMPLQSSSTSLHVSVAAPASGSQTCGTPPLQLSTLWLQTSRVRLTVGGAHDERQLEDFRYQRAALSKEKAEILGQIPSWEWRVREGRTLDRRSSLNYKPFSQPRF